MSIFKELNIEYFYHMTSVQNLDGILDKGLQNHYIQHKKIDISNQDVNNRREKKKPVFGHRIH